MTRVQRPASAPDASVLARTARGMGWIVGWRMVTRVLGLGSTLVLVRLLRPADFGLVALATSFALAVDALSTLGVEDALVRDHAPTREVYDTAFTMNALRGAFTAGLVAALASPVAIFFHQPRLRMVVFALAAGVLVEALESIGLVDFRRRMQFDKEFRLQILPRMIGIAVTIGGALGWRSYWALVAGILAGRVARTALSYRMQPYRPRFTLVAWRRLIGFSLWSWALAITQLMRDRMDAFVIGRALSPTAVGVYAIGEEIAALPTSELVMPLTRATFSGFTAARHAGEFMAETYLRAVSSTFVLTLPAGIGAALVAGPLIRLAVGANWIAAIPVIRIMALVGAFSVFGMIAGVLLSVHGLLRRQWAVTLVCMALRLALLVPLVHRAGIVGAAIAAAAGIAAEHALLVATAFRRFDLGYRNLARRIWRPLLAAAVMAAILRVTDLTAAQGAVALAAAVILGAAAYAGALALTWWLSGRPDGAEADLIRLGRGLIGRG